MIFLDTTSRSLQVVLAAAVATNQLPVVASYLDINQTSFDAVNASANTTATNSTTAVTVVAAPSSGNTRQLKFLSVYNADTAAATVTVEYNDNSTLRVMQKWTLQVGETLIYNSEGGWLAYTANGAEKTNSPLSGATYTGSSQNPAAASSTASFQMQGLAGSITPRTSGNICVIIQGTATATATTIDNGVIVQGSYGTGTAPGSNAALTGTQVGAQLEFTQYVTAGDETDTDLHAPLSYIFWFSGTVGTAYWLDLAAKAVTTASDNPLINVVVQAFEF